MSRQLILSAVVLSVTWCTSAVAAPVSEVVLLDDLHLTETVQGDVFVLGGDIFLSSTARVDGHAVALFGTIHAEPGAVVTGRAIGVSSLASMTLVPSGVEQPWTLRAGLWTLTAGSWLLVTTLLALVWPRRIRSGVQLIPRFRLQTIVVGTLVYLTLFAGLIAVLGMGPHVGVPLVVLVFLAFAFCKAVGLSVIGGVLGSWLLERRARRHIPLTVSVLVGVILCLGVRFVPVVGGVAWSLLSVAALGTSVLCFAVAPTTKALEMPVPRKSSARQR